MMPQCLEPSGSTFDQPFQYADHTHAMTDLPAPSAKTLRPLTSGLIALPSIRIAYAERPGTPLPIVFIHPNRTSNRVWDFVVSASRLPNRMLLPALRGHGDTDWPVTGYRLEDHRDDLIAFIDAMCEGPAILVGQATGATLALMIASLIPGQIRAVVAAQPAIGIAGAVNSLVRDQVLAQQHLASRAAAQAALPFAERWRPEVVAHTLDHMLAPHPSGGFTWRYYGPGVCDTEAELMRDLANDITWRGPTLVFGGAASTVLPVEMAARVAARLPGAQLASLAAANHRLSQDNPEGFAALLDGFVESLDR